MLILGQGPLPPFLKAAAERPFSWEGGDWDCLMWLAEWVKIARGVDPGAAHRHSYRDALGAMRIVKRAGGMVAHVDQCVKPLGIERTDDPKAGDIAVLNRLGDEAETGALVIGKGSAAVLSNVGLLIIPTRARPILAAWRI